MESAPLADDSQIRVKFFGRLQLGLLGQVDLQGGPQKSKLLPRILIKSHLNPPLRLDFFH